MQARSRHPSGTRTPWTLRTAVALILTAWSLGAPCQAPLPPATLDRLHSAGIPDHAMGAIVVRVADGHVLLAHGASRSLQPASTIKLLTAIVALDRLGPASRARTELVTAAPLIA